MADFSAFKITNAGIALEVRVQGGTPIKFTKFMLGDGTFTGNVKNLTALVNPIMEVPVSRLVSQSGDNSKVSIGFDLSSQDVITGFYLREIGIYAEDPDGGNDILVFYGNAGNTADYIEPSTSATMTEKMIDIEMYIDSATTITAVIDSSLVYATQDDINSLQIAINGKAPNSHASSSDTYGIGTTSLFGHVKINNNLTTSSYSNGEVLSAYQGYVLNNSKAPNLHASSSNTYGISTSTLYGHAKLINNLTTSSYADGEALSAYQGYVLNQKFSNYLSKSGGTLTGELNLGANRIKFGNNGNIEFKEDGYGDKFRIIPNFNGADDANILNIQGTVGGAGTDPTNWKTLFQLTAKSGNMTIAGQVNSGAGFNVTTASGETGFVAKRTDTNTEVKVTVGNGGVNHGIYSSKLNKWIAYADASRVYLNGNAESASKLYSAKKINGTNFDGSAEITTAKWGTARTLALSGAVTGSASVDGSGNVTIATKVNYGTSAPGSLATGTVYFQYFN